MFWSDADGGPKTGGWDVQVPSDMGGRGVVCAHWVVLVHYISDIAH